MPAMKDKQNKELQEEIADVTSEEKQDAESEGKKRAKQYKYFEAILYPQDNETNRHLDILNYIMNNTLLFPAACYIKHDHDVGEDGLPLKDHYHILFQVSDKYTRAGMIKHFRGYVGKSLLHGCEHPKAMVLYMVHRTFESEEDGKYLYDDDALIGDETLTKYLKQNANFVQNQVIGNICKNGYMVDVLCEADDLQRQEIMEHAVFYMGISNQQINRRKIGEYYNGNDR